RHRYRVCQTKVPFQPAVGIERQAILRVGNVGAGPRRAQKHSLRHITLPEGHRFAKEPYVQAFRLSKMRCRGKAIRASADNHYITFVHEITDLLHNSPIAKFSETHRYKRGWRFQPATLENFAVSALHCASTNRL